MKITIVIINLQYYGLQSIPEIPTFTLEFAPEPPIFCFAAAHTYQNLGWVPPSHPGVQQTSENL